MTFKIDTTKRTERQGKKRHLNIRGCDNQVERLEKIRIKGGFGSNWQRLIIRYSLHWFLYDNSKQY